MQLVTVQVHGDNYVGWLVKRCPGYIVLTSYSAQYEGADGLYLPPADENVAINLGEFTTVKDKDGNVL